MNRSPTGRMLEATSKHLRTPQYQPNTGAQRVIDAYRQEYGLGLIDWADPAAERVLAVPRTLGAPYGAVAQRQWAKREQVQARLRIARKRKQ